jgi:hypothetical protein
MGAGPGRAEMAIAHWVVAAKGTRALIRSEIFREKIYVVFLLLFDKIYLTMN